MPALQNFCLCQKRHFVSANILLLQTWLPCLKGAVKRNSALSACSTLSPLAKATPTVCPHNSCGVKLKAIPTVCPHNSCDAIFTEKLLVTLNFNLCQPHRLTKNQKKLFNKPHYAFNTAYSISITIGSIIGLLFVFCHK